MEGWQAWVAVACALLSGGWLLFDGLHALLGCDYVTPKSGRFAGQLGPWAKLLARFGLDPRSTVVKLLHVDVGSGLVLFALLLLCGLGWAKWGLVAFAALSLWYLPFGTLLGIVTILCLTLL